MTNFTGNLFVMGKINKFFKSITLILKQPALLNNVINDEKQWQKQVSKRHQLENGLPVVDINELIPGFSGRLEIFSFLDGGSLPTDILLLKKLAESINDCSYFEIGTWRGESVANVAPVAKECYSLNLGDEELRKLNFPEEYIAQQALYSKKIPTITHLHGDSRTFDFAGLNKKFDLVFIDGDHHYEFVKNDTEKVFAHLLHDESIVVWHDYAYNPEKIRFEVLAGILDALPEEMHKNIYHVGNTLTAIYTKKQLNTAPLDPPVKPKHIFQVDLGVKELT